ncbi:MAG: hypothetical protein KIT87_14165 [Anaerolineae bacterium]|nr:hypothetical protein [Anaerolineae bacterium]
MISTQLMDELHKLNRVEKLKVVQLLIKELAEQEAEPVVLDAYYEIWTPYDTPGATQALLELLEEDRQSPNA